MEVEIILYVYFKHSAWGHQNFGAPGICPPLSNGESAPVHKQPKSFLSFNRGQSNITNRIFTDFNQDWSHLDVMSILWGKKETYILHLIFFKYPDLVSLVFFLSFLNSKFYEFLALRMKYLRYILLIRAVCQFLVDDTFYMWKIKSFWTILDSCMHGFRFDHEEFSKTLKKWNLLNLNQLHWLKWNNNILREISLKFCSVV